MEVYHAAFAKIKDVKNLLFSITFEPIPVSLIKQSVARGGNAMGLDPSDGPLMVVLFYTSWDERSDDEKMYAAVKEALATIEEEAKKNDVYSLWLYLNYASPHQNAMASYSKESKARLEAVSKKYDADGFFQISGIGPCKLSK